MKLNRVKWQREKNSDSNIVTFYQAVFIFLYHTEL